MNAVEKSVCAYEAMLNDIRVNYPFAGGGWDYLDPANHHYQLRGNDRTGRAARYLEL